MKRIKHILWKQIYSRNTKTSVVIWMITFQVVTKESITELLAITLIWQLIN